MMIVGKYKQPSGYEKVKSFPAKYRYNDRAWMTRILFEENLRVLDEMFQLEKRHVVMITDSSTSHANAFAGELRNVKLIILPPVLTPKIQPLHMGVIKDLKHCYRQQLIKKHARAFNAKANIDAMQAMTMLVDSWNKMSQDRIARSFRDSSWSQDQMDDDADEDSDSSDENILDVDIRIAFDRLNRDGYESYWDFVNFDNDLATSKILTDEDVFDLIDEEDGLKAEEA